MSQLLSSSALTAAVSLFPKLPPFRHNVCKEIIACVLYVKDSQEIREILSQSLCFRPFSNSLAAFIFQCDKETCIHDILQLETFDLKKLILIRSKHFRLLMRFLPLRLRKGVKLCIGKWDYHHCILKWMRMILMGCIKRICRMSYVSNVTLLIWLFNKNY